MLPSSVITAIHCRLQNIFGGGLVLLGGSYAYGEATDASDVDFYVIASLWRVRAYLKDRAWTNELKELFGDVKINISFFPRFTFDKGWYYVYGKDLDGATHVSNINHAVIFRNCLKLAYWHYLNHNFIKAAKLLIAGMVVWRGALPDAPLLSSKVLQDGLRHFALKERRALGLVLESRVDGTLQEPSRALEILDALRRAIIRAHEENQGSLGFSIANYVIYNFHFLRRGSGRFLFCRPDKMILNLLRERINNEPHGLSLEEIKKRVFPILSLEI